MTDEQQQWCAWCGRLRDGQPGECPGHCQACEGCHASGTSCHYPDDDWRTGILPGTWAARTPTEGA